MKRWMLGALVPLCLLGCSGTTGGDWLEFSAYAAGPSDAIAGQPYQFTTDAGYRVTLTRAKLHLGALYLNRSMPVLGSQETSCILPGQYVAQVTSGLDVDVLSPALQPFASSGIGTSNLALAAEVWLTGGRVDSADDKTAILDIAGQAEKDNQVYPFEGIVTIGQNRQLASSDPATPGANPLCKQRIVSPIAVQLTPQSGGQLVVRVHPQGWLSQVNFSMLQKASESPPLYRFRDDLSGQPEITLFNGLRSISGVYDLQWEEPSK